MISMIYAAAGPCARCARSLVRGRAIKVVQIRSLSASSLGQVHGAALSRFGGTSAAGGAGLPTLPTRYSSSRSMSTGKDTAPPDDISGFGRRQKAVDSGNTALGKGFDLMEDDAESRRKIVIDGYDKHGFQLEDGTDVRGSMICLPNSYVLWEPKRAADITIESLRLLELVIPKIDLVILGVGERMSKRLDPALVKHLSSKGIRVEQMDSVNACSTFNVLNAEDRRVAAALIQLTEEEEEP